MQQNYQIPFATSLQWLAPSEKPEVKLACEPGSFVYLELPEYDAFGIGAAFCRVKEFVCASSGQTGLIARSVCADTSRALVVDASMRPYFLGDSHKQLQSDLPKPWVHELYSHGLSVDQVSFAATRAKEFERVSELLKLVLLYSERASVIEAEALYVEIIKIMHSDFNIIFNNTTLNGDSYGNE